MNGIFTILEVKSREERSNQFFPEDQMILLNDTWLEESNEQRQDSVLLQLEDTEDRMKLALDREEKIGNIVQSVGDLRHIFKVREFDVFHTIAMFYYRRTQAF